MFAAPVTYFLFSLIAVYGGCKQGPVCLLVFLASSGWFWQCHAVLCHVEVKNLSPPSTSAWKIIHPIIPR